MKRFMFVLMFCLLVVLAACSNDDTTNVEQEERVVAVETAEVKEEDFILERVLYGRAIPNQIAPIILPLAGELTELDVSNGETVEEGDRIAVFSTAQGNTTVTAPADGKITGLQASEGDMVSNEEPFATVADTDVMIVEFAVTAELQQILTKDETYTVEVANEEFPATVTQIDFTPDDSGLYPVQATVENEENIILPGMVARITIPEQVIEDTFLVPTQAVVHENDEDFIYVVTNDKAEKRTITVLETGSDTSAIEGEIEAGEEVVITGQLTLSDGDQVDVKEEE